MKREEVLQQLEHFADTLAQYGKELGDAATALIAIEKHAEGNPSAVAGIGMAWQDIAASAYKAYAASTGNKNYQGAEMPDWNDLPPAIHTAWEAASRQVWACLTLNDRPPDEQNWAGWTPPHYRPAGEQFPSPEQP